MENEKTSLFDQHRDPAAQSHRDISFDDKTIVPKGEERPANSFLTSPDKPVPSHARSANDNVHDPRIGTVLNERYRVTERLAEGCMGAVYLGELIRLEKPVAIKFLHDLLLFNANSRARFVREAQAMSKLSHPHCVSVLDYGIDGSPYIVMDYVTGKSLDIIIEQEQITLARAIRIVLQILAGLAHAHDQGIIHRDIKPANIIINEAAGTGEHVRILDFSLAKITDDSSMSLTGAIMGTPSYMSPEQSFGVDVDARTDLYSVGVVTFELLTGQNPFPSEDIDEILQMQRETMAPGLGQVVPDISFSDEIEAVLKKALAKSRDERFSSAYEFMEALAAVPEAGDLGELPGGKISVIRLGGSAETRDLTSAEDGAKNEQPGQTAQSTLPERLIGPRKAIIFSGFFVVTVILIALVVALSTSSKKEAIGTTAAPISKSQPVKPLSHPAQLHQEAKEEAIRNAKNLISAGQTEGAISVLQKIRASYPKAPEPAYLLGNLFSEKSWWSDAMERYENAIELNPDYTKDPILNKNVIRALAIDKYFPAAQTLILKQLGPDAIPHLLEAINEESSVIIRRRAAKILKELTANQPSTVQ